MDDVLGYAGKQVVVTGAASGMGEATAQVLVDLGADVIGIDLNPTKVAVRQSLEVDLRDRGAIDGAVGRIQGAVDAVFNVAGLPGPPFSDLDVMLVNFVGARHLIESLVPSMPGGGAIAYVSSAAGIGWQGNLANLMGLLEAPDFEAGKAWCEAHPEIVGASAYATSKQVIMAWTAWRAVPLMKDHGLRLNCTCPGPTSTAMMPFFHESAGKAIVDAAQGPVGRYSTAEEQAWPLVFLNSPRASYVTGESFYSDGGFFGALQTGQVDFSALMPS
jgi:NAD(P)-dependent dehydrogenase (short-subunit alcohol dehydrogenase family)